MAEQVKEKLSLASENSGVIFMPVSAPLDLPCSAKKEVSPKVGRGRKNTQISHICITCGKAFLTHPCQIRRGLKNCSHKCAGKSRIGQHNGRKKGTKNKLSHQIIQVCITCGKTFLTYPCRLRRNPPIKNCSRKCANKSNIGKFVGLKSGTWTGGKTKRICKICNKEFFALKRVNRKFCSWKCYYKGRSIYSGANNHQWLGGISFEPYTPSFNQQLKDKIRVRDNFVCQGKDCAIPELELGRRLSIHHIDYNKNNCAENNLISLCIRCNIKANYNRTYWEEYFSVRNAVKAENIQSIR